MQARQPTLPIPNRTAALPTTAAEPTTAALPTTPAEPTTAALPTTPADVGLDADQFVKVVEFAPRTRPDRYTILEHLEMKPDEIEKAKAAAAAYTFKTK